MIRLMLLLCAGLYFTLLILGEDHGQKRYGLMLADQPPVVVAAPVAPVAEPVKEVVFIPAQTVMTPAAPVVEAVATPVETPETAALPEPQIDGGRLFTVAAEQANVREGPGKGFAVLGRLTQGEQVLVVIEENAVDGWSRVRLEGDGIEGYVATRLLTQ